MASVCLSVSPSMFVCLSLFLSLSCVSSLLLSLLFIISLLFFLLILFSSFFLLASPCLQNPVQAFDRWLHDHIFCCVVNAMAICSFSRCQLDYKAPILVTLSHSRGLWLGSNSPPPDMALDLLWLHCAVLDGLLSHPTSRLSSIRVEIIHHLIIHSPYGPNYDLPVLR